MRRLTALSLAITLTLATTAQARLFWQTYGSTVPAADGCGCHWNVNQDFFVPRHSHSCRYGLYSPCKTSCTTSPACKWCHPIHHGYCSIYGPCHYRRRNHVYAARCGCTPMGFCLSRCVRRRGCCCGGVCGGCGACGRGACGATCVAGCCPGAYYSGISAYPEVCTNCDVVAPLHNVEPSSFVNLGSIPLEGSELLTRTDFSGLGSIGQQAPQSLLLQQQASPAQSIQIPTIPQPGGLTQPLPSP